MIMTFPADFDYDHPSANLIYCPKCRKFQHFRFRNKWMDCYGCGTPFQWSSSRLKVRPYDNTNRKNKGPKYGPPRFLLCMNAVIDHPD